MVPLQVADEACPGHGERRRPASPPVRMLPSLELWGYLHESHLRNTRGFQARRNWLRPLPYCSPDRDTHVPVLSQQPPKRGACTGVKRTDPADAKTSMHPDDPDRDPPLVRTTNRHDAPAQVCHAGRQVMRPGAKGDGAQTGEARRRALGMLHADHGPGVAAAACEAAQRQQKMMWRAA